MEPQTAKDVLLQELAKTIQQGKAFVLEQAPDIIRQWVSWNLISSIMQVVLCGLTIIFCYKFTRWTISKMDDDEWGGAAIIGTVVGVCIGLFMIGFTIEGIYTALHIYFAPKAWMLEQLLKR